ncbi:prolipoprotein diacylglyceryltransferase [Flavobacterium croceum DSM 17960]|uniref:Prolipoprotein diacylglyceryltransferase n=1 Tax=Flavobacterium croceum DSM 17960 TaxID=1121886 RepID=A0A2S4N7K9_9FLAO|nr:prolipoprotein diacylglyceryl transferase family protein [Flavobacterium croceum]POS01696.1 prolipoprotein diacylglyceryltransferase [Flavobacterium croceum DSM 17960]
MYFGPQNYLIHIVCETLAFFVGVQYYYHLKNKNVDIINSKNRLWILIGAMFGALIGSRVIALFEIPEALKYQTLSTIYQNKTVAGGFIGGLFGVEFIKKIIGEKKSSGDIYVLPIIVALFIGRIGCFCMGVGEQTYGIETDFFTGMNLGDGKMRHPIALYEMLYLLLLYILFKKIQYKDMVNGDRFKLFMVLYFVYRFCAEFIKPYHSLFLHLSVHHWCALFIFGYYYKFILKFNKNA